MKCKHHIIQMLVPPDIYAARGELAWELIDISIILTLDKVVEVFDEVPVINNWHLGGNFVDSGFRTPENTKYARLSQHKFGRAVDMKFGKHKVQDVWNYILSHREDFPHVSCMEDIAFTPSWVHVDCRNHDRIGIKIVKP